MTIGREVDVTGRAHDSSTGDESRRGGPSVCSLVSHPAGVSHALHARLDRLAARETRGCIDQAPGRSEGRPKAAL
jgi:hypothetical protein